MATITTYICDCCSTEVKRLCNFRVTRYRPRTLSRMGESDTSIDLCEPCSEKVLEILRDYFHEPQSFGNEG